MSILKSIEIYKILDVYTLKITMYDNRAADHKGIIKIFTILLFFTCEIAS